MALISRYLIVVGKSIRIDSPDQIESNRFTSLMNGMKIIFD